MVPPICRSLWSGQEGTYSLSGLGVALDGDGTVGLAGRSLVRWQSVSQLLCSLLHTASYMRGSAPRAGQASIPAGDGASPPRLSVPEASWRWVVHDC